MACGNARREAYTAGGEATLLSLEILNVDAFVSGSAPRPHCNSGGRTGSAAQGEAPRVVRGQRTSAKPREGSPGNLGGPALSTTEGRMDPWPKPRVRARPCLRGRGSEPAGAAWYRLVNQSAEGKQGRKS